MNNYPAYGGIIVLLILIVGPLFFSKHTNAVYPKSEQRNEEIYGCEIIGSHRFTVDQDSLRLKICSCK